MKNWYLIKPISEYIHNKYKSKLNTNCINIINEINEILHVRNPNIENKYQQFIAFEWLKKDIKQIKEQCNQDILLLGDMYNNHLEHEETYRENIQAHIQETKLEIIDTIKKYWKQNNISDDLIKLVFDLITELFDLSPYWYFNQANKIHISEKEKMIFDIQDYEISNLHNYKQYWFFSSLLLKTISYHNDNNIFQQLWEIYIAEYNDQIQDITVVMKNINHIIESHIKDGIPYLNKEYEFIREKRKEILINFNSIEQQQNRHKNQLIELTFSFDNKPEILRTEPMYYN